MAEQDELENQVDDAEDSSWAEAFSLGICQPISKDSVSSTVAVRHCRRGPSLSLPSFAVVAVVAVVVVVLYCRW